MSETTKLGNLRSGDIFNFEGRTYKVGHCIDNAPFYVACVDMETHKVTRFCIDDDVVEVCPDWQI